MFENLINNMAYIPKIGIINQILITTNALLLIEAMIFIASTAHTGNRKPFPEQLSAARKIFILLSRLVFDIIMLWGGAYLMFTIFSNLKYIDTWLSGLSKEDRCFIGMLEILLLVMLMAIFNNIKKTPNNNAG